MVYWEQHFFLHFFGTDGFIIYECGKNPWVYSWVFNHRTWHGWWWNLLLGSCCFFGVSLPGYQGFWWGTHWGGFCFCVTFLTLCPGHGQAEVYVVGWLWDAQRWRVDVDLSQNGEYIYIYCYIHIFIHILHIEILFWVVLNEPSNSMNGGVSNDSISLFCICTAFTLKATT